MAGVMGRKALIILSLLAAGILAVALVAGFHFMGARRNLPADGPGGTPKRAGGETSSGPIPREGSKEARPSEPGITFLGTAFTITGPDGNVEWEASARKIEVLQDGRVVKLEDVLVRNLEGKSVVLSMKAGVARFLLDQEKLELAGRVSVEGRVASRVPAKFDADEVSCDMKARTLLARGQVEYIHGATRISADELASGFDLSRVTARGNVRLVGGPLAPQGGGR